MVRPSINSWCKIQIVFLSCHWILRLPILQKHKGCHHKRGVAAVESHDDSVSRLKMGGTTIRILIAIYKVPQIRTMGPIIPIKIKYLVFHNPHFQTAT